MWTAEQKQQRSQLLTLSTYIGTRSGTLYYLMADVLLGVAVLAICIVMSTRSGDKIWKLNSVALLSPDLKDGKGQT